MAVKAKPKAYVGDVSTTVSTIHNAPAAVPSDWGAGYASGQMKHLTICNGSTSVSAAVFVTVGTKMFLNDYAIPAKGVFDWEGTELLSSGWGITIEGTSGGSSLCDYSLSVIDFTS